MIFSPPARRVPWESLIVCIWSLIIDGLLLLWAARRPIDWLKFALIFVVLASLPFLLHLAYRTWAALTLEYQVDRNAVTIRWAGARQIIPLHAIRRVIRGGLQDLSAPRRLDWPAEDIRRSQALGLLNVRMLAARPLEECLLLETTDGVYALSPAAEDEFLDALQARYRFGPSRSVEMSREYTTRLGEFFSANPAGLVLLIGGLAGVLALAGLLMVRFPGLPDELVMQVNSDGLPLSVRSKDALFLLPAMGFLAWLLNSVAGLWLAARGQAVAAYLLWGGTIVVQLFSLLALFSLLP
ncbi:MAG: hypothetical protein KDD92_07590 [Caldilineaceae bacterium]|nr:hypothetical protein [Caldilineaceae bacterium]